MKRSVVVPGVVFVLLTGLFFLSSRLNAQEKKPTAKDKMATLAYFVGSWDCTHTVGGFSGRYTTEYTQTLGDAWLRQTYNFPPGQFGDRNQPAVTAEALIGYDEARDQWVRFFAASHGDHFAIRMKEIKNGWTYQYVRFFGDNTASRTDATITRKSATEYVIDGPSYPENGKTVTEHHECHKR